MNTIGYTTWLGIDGLKAFVSAKKIPVNRIDEGYSWHIIATDGNITHECRIFKDNGTDHTDFETSYESLNSAMAVRADLGRPQRVSPSSQPGNTTEKWKGYHVEIAENETEKTILINFPNDVFLRGGNIYSDDCSCKDYFTVDVVWTEYPAMVIYPNLLETIYMTKNTFIPFISAECMKFPPMLSLQITYYKYNDSVARCVSAVANFYEPNQA
jgi:hypothetical protein